MKLRSAGGLGLLLAAACSNSTAGTTAGSTTGSAAASTSRGATSTGTTTSATSGTSGGSTSTTTTSSTSGTTGVVLGPVIASITVDPSQLGLTIPRDFAGLSFEADESFSPTQDDFFGNPLPDGGPGPANAVAIQLLENLGQGTLRIGGNSVDSTCFDVFTNPRCQSYFDPSDMTQVFQTATRTGWRVLLGLDLGIGNPQAAIDEVVQGVLPLNPGPLLLGLEIGNEPDDFPTHSVTVTYPDGGSFTYTIRDAGYDVADIESDTMPYVAALKGNTQTSAFPLAGPAGADPVRFNLVTYVPAVEVDGAGMSLLTVHAYPTNVCPTTLPDSGSYGTIANLLSAANAAKYQQRLGASVLESLDAGLPIQLAESNSTACGGVNSPSNTLTSALWGLDWMGMVASLGFTGVNFHGGGPTNGYSPIAVEGTATPAQAQPLYYAMLAFSESLSGRTLIGTTVDGGAYVTAYSVTDPDAGVLRVLAVNKDLIAGGHVDVFAPANATAQLTTLTGAALDAGTVTWGGQQADNTTGLIPAPVPTSVPYDSDAGCYHVPLPNGAAGVLQIPMP